MTCADCKALPIRVLRSRLACFDEHGQACVPCVSGPASVEAARRLRSWGSQRDLADENETAEALSHSSSDDPVAPVSGAEVRAAASSDHDQVPILRLSASKEVDVLSIDTDDRELGAPVHGQAYEELVRL